MDPILIVAVIFPWILVIFLGVLMYQLIQRHGAALLREEDVARRLSSNEETLRVLLEQAADRRIAAAEERLSELSDKVESVSARGLAPIPVMPPPPPPLPQPSGIAVGSKAPDFKLKDLDGKSRSLSDFIGEPRIVVFFDPQCGFCQRMSPRLAELPSDAPKFLMVTRREPSETRAMMDRDGWHFDTVVDNDWRVTNSYGTSGTPTGYLIDSEGKIASDLAVGADALLNLVPAAKSIGSGGNGHGHGNGNGHSADLTADSLQAKTDAANEKARAAGLGVRDSQINREGLKAGTKAPNFTLPDLKGRKHSLSDYRGRKVLLVFSDPDCGPCMSLAPKLVDINAGLGPNETQIVVVSRGELAKNLAKEHEFGINYTVLLQKHWEISKDYAMFATPVGYLIDEKGTLLTDVAIGADAILQLIEPITA